MTHSRSPTRNSVAGTRGRCGQQSVCGCRVQYHTQASVQMLVGSSALARFPALRGLASWSYCRPRPIMMARSAEV